MTIKPFSLALAITLLCALFSLAQAQTPRLTTVNITPEADKVHISAIGDVSEMRIEVSDEQGDVVFQSGAITGNTLDWSMQDPQGERVSAGTYLVTVTFRTAAGKLRKRVEQVTIAEDEKASTKTTAAPNAVQAAITGAGTNGKIAKFTGASTIANSVMTESANRIGIGTAAPTSTLTVAGMIQTTGASGGVKFADNSVQTKAGLTTVAHNTTLSGAGTTASPLTVANLGVGNAQLANNAVTAPKIAAGQVVKSINGLEDNVTLTAGSNVTITPSGNQLTIASTGGMTQWTTSGTDIFYNTGNVGIGTSSPLVKLHVVGATTAASQLPILAGENTSSGFGVAGKSSSGDGVRGESDTSGSGVRGKSNSGNGVRGISNSGEGVHGESNSGTGVYGQSTSGEAGHFEGKVKVNGDLESNALKVNGALEATGKVTGTGNPVGVEGTSTSGEGVRGSSGSGTGLKGISTSGIGVLGTSTSGEAGHFEGKVKINGDLESNALKVNGSLEVTGTITGIGGGAGSIGLFASSLDGEGVHGEATGGIGVKGVSSSSTGVFGTSTTGYAGYFDGKARVVANLEIGGNVGVGTSTPKTRLHVVGGQLFIDNNNGIILMSPEGMCYLLGVANGGSLFVQSIPCPN